MAKRFAYELIVNKIKCPYCGNDEVVDTWEAKMLLIHTDINVRLVGFMDIYIRTILNQYFNYIRLEKNLSSDIKIIF